MHFVTTTLNIARLVHYRMQCVSVEVSKQLFRPLYFVLGSVQIKSITNFTVINLSYYRTGWGQGQTRKIEMN